MASSPEAGGSLFTLLLLAKSGLFKAAALRLPSNNDMVDACF